MKSHFNTIARIALFVVPVHAMLRASHMVSGFQGLGFMVLGSQGFRVSGFRVQGFRF